MGHPSFQSMPMSRELDEERMRQSTDFFICNLHKDPEYHRLCSEIRRKKISVERKPSPWSFLGWATFIAFVALVSIQIPKHQSLWITMSTSVAHDTSARGQEVPVSELSAGVVQMVPERGQPHMDAGLSVVPVEASAKMPLPSQRLPSVLTEAVSSFLPAAETPQPSSTLQPLTQPRKQQPSEESILQLPAYLCPLTATSEPVQPQQLAPSLPTAAEAAPAEPEKEAPLSQAAQTATETTSEGSTLVLGAAKPVRATMNADLSAAVRSTEAASPVVIADATHDGLIEAPIALKDAKTKGLAELAYEVVMVSLVLLIMASMVLGVMVLLGLEISASQFFGTAVKNPTCVVATDAPEDVYVSSTHPGAPGEEPSSLASPCAAAAMTAVYQEFDTVTEACDVVEGDSGKVLLLNCKDATAAQEAFFTSESMEGFSDGTRDVSTPFFNACLLDAAASHAKPPGMDTSLARFGSPAPMAVNLLTPPEPPSPFPGFPPLVGDVSLHLRPDTDLETNLGSGTKSVSWGSTPEGSGQCVNRSQPELAAAEGLTPGASVEAVGNEPASPEATPWPFTYPSSGERARVAETPTESTGSTGPSSVVAFVLPIADGDRPDAAIFDLNTFNDNYCEDVVALAPPSPWVPRILDNQDDTNAATAGDTLGDTVQNCGVPLQSAEQSITSVADVGQESQISNWRMMKSKQVRACPRASDIQPSDIFSATDSTASAYASSDGGSTTQIKPAETALGENTASTPMWPPKAAKVVLQSGEEEAHALIAAEALSLADSLICNSGASIPALTDLSLRGSANSYANPASEPSGGEVPELMGPVGDPWSAIAGRDCGDRDAATEATEGLLKRRHEPGRDYAATAAATQVLFAAIKEQSRNVRLSAMFDDNVQFETAQRGLLGAIAQLLEVDLAPNAHTALARSCKALAFSAAATPANPATPPLTYSSGGGVSWASIGSRVASGGPVSSSNTPMVEMNLHDVHMMAAAANSDAPTNISSRGQYPHQAHAFSDGAACEKVSYPSMIAGRSRIPRASSTSGARPCAYGLNSRIPQANQPSEVHWQEQRQVQSPPSAAAAGPPTTPVIVGASTPVQLSDVAADVTNVGHAYVTPNLQLQGRLQLPTPVSEAPTTAAVNEDTVWPEGPAPLPANIDAYLEARNANKSPLEFVLSGFQGTVAHQGLLITSMANEIRNLMEELAFLRSQDAADGKDAKRLDDVAPPKSPARGSQTALPDDDGEDVIAFGIDADGDFLNVSSDEAELSSDGLQLAQLALPISVSKLHEQIAQGSAAPTSTAEGGLTFEGQDSGDAAWVCVEASVCDASVSTAAAVAALSEVEEEQVVFAATEEVAAVALLSLRQEVDAQGTAAWRGKQETVAPSPARSEVSKMVERVLNHAVQLSDSNVMKIYAPPGANTGVHMGGEVTGPETEKMVVETVEPVVAELVQRQFDKLRTITLGGLTPDSSAGSCGGDADSLGRCRQYWFETGIDTASCTSLLPIEDFRLSTEASGFVE